MVKNKFDKLNELGELLKSGAISKEEFETLKKEVFETSISESIEVPSESGNHPASNINVEKNVDGFNYPLWSILSVGSGLLAIYMIKLSPCLMYFGGIGAIVNSFICSLYVLSRKDATKSDKTASAIGLILVVFAFVFFGITWKESLK